MYPTAIQGQAGAQFGGMPINADQGMWADLQKAVTAGYGSDSASLVGGGSLRVESLEHTLMSVVQTVDHFSLFNRLKKSAATATVDEWTEHSDIGGRPGGAFNMELGDIQSSTGSYARRVAFVKYMMTRRSVSVVQNMQNAIISAEAQEQIDGTLELLTSAEWGLFFGNSAVVPEEFDGLDVTIRNVGSADHVIDVGGLPLDDQGFKLVLQGASTIAGLKNFGKPTDLYLSYNAQTDMDLKLDPAFRVPLTDVGAGGVSLGAPVAGVRTSFGKIGNNPDVFIQEGAIPPEAEIPAAHTVADPTVPVSVTAVAASDTSSKFAAGQDGNYYWGVTSVNRNGESAMALTTQTAVAVGEKATLTITRPATLDATGYKIYRSRTDGTNDPLDMRFMFRVADSGAGTTVYVDLNREIPGTSQAFMLNLNPALNAIGWRQLMPMTRFPLYPTVKAEVPWAQLLFGYLRVTKARQHILLKNILPAQNKDVWDPFGAAA